MDKKKAEQVAMKKYSNYLFVLLLIVKIHDSRASLNKFNSSNIKIYLDSNELDKLGYNDSNFRKNGEGLVIKNFIKNGDTIFDVGAHIGEWSALVLKHNLS